MAQAALLMLLAAALLASAAGAAPSVPSGASSRLAREEIFAPDKFFEGSGESDVLTARYLQRDGVYPAYAVAVRYGACIANASGGCDHRLDIRFLRHKGSDDLFRRARAFLGRMTAANVKSPDAARRFARRDTGLDWLATDTLACPGSFEAIDAVRRSLWTPPPDHRLTESETEIWTHVPIYEIAMGDLYGRVTYRGPLYGNRPSGALDALIDKLEPCWKPNMSARPWDRRRKD